MTSPTPRAPQIACAILAAGAGTRFGGQKLATPFAGKPLVQWAVDAACASRATACGIVLADDGRDEIVATVDLRRCAELRNAHAREGIASSIRCAARAFEDYDGLLLALGDRPRVITADLDELIAAFSRDPSKMYALRCEEVWGAPMLFGREHLPALAALTGDEGAKRYALSKPERVVKVDARRADAFADIDLPGDVVTSTSESRNR
jgi:molybdenum cofactor cytidylyltransferase